MADQVKNIMIGLFIIASTAIIVFILLFLNPAVGDEGQTLRIRFADIDKVNIGTRVSYGGRPVGEVIEIIPLYLPGQPRVIHDDIVYLYELKLMVDTSVKVYSTDEIFLRTSGLLGEKSVEINPLPPKPDVEVFLLNDKIIYAKETGSVEQTFKEFKEVADRFDVALEKISSILTDIKEKQLIDKLTDTFANLSDITQALNKPEEWSETIDNIHIISANVVDSWEQVDEVLETLTDVSDNVLDLTDSGKVIAANIRDGDGTVGRLVMSDDLYLRVTSLLSKAEITMDDVNHYGILFHTDKAWQRLRARRMNLLDKLCTPQEFRNYFNDEIDEISTSLSRVSMVLDKTQNACYSWSIATDCEFQKVYAELLRRVATLEEALQMYNQQLTDIKVKETKLNCCY